MKRASKLSVALATAMLVTMLTAPAWAGRAPGSGMAGSPHDFSGDTVTVTSHSGSSYTGTVGMCTYCHTPHHALSTLLLWNQQLSTTTYSWDVPATTSGTQFPTFTGNTYLGPTAKCLSCHDGTVAVGDLNLFEDKGIGVGGTVPSATGGLSGSFQIAGDTQFNSIQAPNGSRGNFAGNHPVAMPYPYNQVANTYNLVTTGAYNGGAGFNPSEWVAQPTLPLFNDSRGQVITAGAVPGSTGIECSTCHDVHNGPLVQDNYLVLGLLTGNTSSYICLKCHIK